MTKREFDIATQHTFIHQGGDIDTMVRSYFIDDVKVDFTINPLTTIYEVEILADDKHAISYGTLKIASLETLFAMKSLLLLDRNKIRDLRCSLYDGAVRI